MPFESNLWGSPFLVMGASTLHSTDLHGVPPSFYSRDDVSRLADYVFPDLLPSVDMDLGLLAWRHFVATFVEWHSCFSLGLVTPSASWFPWRAMVSLEGFRLNRFEPPRVPGFAYGDHYVWYYNVELVLHRARFPCQLCLAESGPTGGSSRALPLDYCLSVTRRSAPRVVSSVRGTRTMPPLAWR